MKNVIVFTSDKENLAIKDLLIAGGCSVSVFTDIDNCIQTVYCWDNAGLFIDVCNQKNSQETYLAYCAKIKNLNPQFPIILLIHGSDISFAVKAAQIGMKYIFEKPLHKKDISIILDNILPKEKMKNIPLIERLTANEKRIVKHVLNGYTNKEISHLLDRSIRTIEEHRSNIMKKMDVDSTVDLLNRSLQVGIVKPEDFISAS